MKRDFEQIDDIQQKVHTIPEQLPILPVRDAVIFPNAVIPLTVGRESSVKLINDVQQGDGMLVVLTQRDKRVDAPAPTDLYDVGTVSMVHRVMKTPEGNLFVIIMGVSRTHMEESVQFEPYLREQLRAIQRELGESDDTQREIEELRQKIEAAGMPEEAKKEAERELGRLGRMSPAAAEYTVTRTYLDWLVTLPWNILTTERIDIIKARDVLDRDHYDLEKIKERILEYLAVLELRPQGKAPILCFVGPPGVGKTSLGRSIAGAMGRKFVRISLGGMRDEAEIRGHRRTYIGALPGQIIQNVRRAGSRDPVFMLDEIDKLGADFRGDPASALLEVLDPEQNIAFRDHYLDVAFDLSRVFFIH